MKKFALAKYFLCKIVTNTQRFDTEYSDPRHKEITKYLENIKIKKKYEITAIGKLCDPFSGKTADKYVDNGIPIIKLRNVTGKGIDWETDNVEEEFFDENKKFHLKLNDVLLTSTGDGTIGRVDILEKNIATMVDGHVTVLRINDDKKLLPKYLLYFLRSKLGQSQINRIIVGSTGQTELNDPDIGNILVAHPKEITEQQSIIDITTKNETSAENKEKQVDDKLNKIDELIHKELNFKIPHTQPKFYTTKITALSDRIDFEFHNPFYDEYEKTSKNSKYPFVPLHKLVTFSSESINPLEKPDDSFLYVDIGNVDTKWGVVKPESMLGYEATSDRMRRLMHEGQVLVSTTRPTRRAITIIPKELEGQVCSTGFAVLQCNEGLDNQYLFHILRSHIITPQFERYSTGSGYPEISKDKDLPQIKIPYPEDITIQQEIVNKINSIINNARKLHDESVDERQKTIDIFESFL